MADEDDGAETNPLDVQQLDILSKTISPLLKEHFGSAVIVVSMRMKAGGEDATIVRTVGNSSYAKGLLYDGYHLMFSNLD